MDFSDHERDTLYPLLRFNPGAANDRGRVYRDLLVFVSLDCALSNAYMVSVVLERLHNPNGNHQERTNQ